MRRLSHRCAVLAISISTVLVLSGSVGAATKTTTKTTTKSTTKTTTKSTPKASTKTTAKTATPNPNAAFCNQLTASQASIASATGTQKQKWQQIAAEWQKIEIKAPSAVKSDVKAVKTAFTKAAEGDEATGKKTLAGIATQSKKITTFVTSNCAKRPPVGDGARGGDPARMAELRACLEKAGVAVPEPDADGARPNFDDPKVLAAAQECGFGGPGGRSGGRGMSDKVRECVAAQGITLPTPGNGGGSGGASGSGSGSNTGRGGGGRPNFDEKTRAAIEACRAANP